MVLESLEEVPEEAKKEANSFPWATIFFPLFNTETFPIEIKPEGQENRKESSPAEDILKENMLPEKINLGKRPTPAESLSENFMTLLKEISTVYPYPAKDSLPGQEAATDQLGELEANGEEASQTLGIKENKIRLFLARQNGQEQMDIGQKAPEKIDPFSIIRETPLNLSSAESKAIKGANGDNPNFNSLKRADKEEIFVGRKEPAIMETLLTKEKIKEALMEMPEEKLKNEQANFAFLNKEKVGSDKEESLWQDVVIRNGWPFSVKEESRSISHLMKENKFEQSKLWGKDFGENFGGRTDPDLDNFPALDKNLTFSLFKGEKRGNTKLDYFPHFSPEVSGKDPLLGRDNLAETGGVWGKENLSQWRPGETEIYKQISQRIIWSIKNDQELIKVTLEPPHLGNIYIEVTREKENIRAKILTENPLTKELIEHNYWPIQKIIEKEGFRLERFDVFSPLDMNLSDGAKGEHLSSKSKDRVYHSAGEIKDQISLENSLPLETNNGGINILI
ncbi:MAG: flagellar hook-length control protein FliK [Thermodesulfobacteriota bacterium]